MKALIPMHKRIRSLKPLSVHSIDLRTVSAILYLGGLDMPFCWRAVSASWLPQKLLTWVRNLYDKGLDMFKYSNNVIRISQFDSFTASGAHFLKWAISRVCSWTYQFPNRTFLNIFFSVTESCVECQYYLVAIKLEPCEPCPGIEVEPHLSTYW